LISSSNTNFLSSNYIGLAPDGQSPMGNKIGVQLLQATDNHIGTATAGEQNIISANTNKGVQLAMNSNVNFIQNNFLGTTASGNQVFGGTGNGDAIHISFSNNNLIGGNSALEEGNVVCFSDDLGIWLENASGTTITGNNI